MNTNTMPVTIISGFLGAGKTSFLNAILQQHPGANFLIIENEAGHTNIDSELVKSNSQSSVFEMTGGCICCSLSTELGTLLNSIILSRVKYDYVLIEATGMADSGQIISMFSGARIQRFFRLDAVVGLVDASNFLERLDNFREVRAQVAKSDLVLINKCDLLSLEDIKRVEEKVKSINPLAKIEQTTYGQLEGIDVLNTESFSASKIEESIIDFTQMTLFKTDNEHAHKIQTLNFTIPGDLDMERVAAWFEDLLFINKENILRIKALLSIDALKHKLILQSVGGEYYTSQGKQWDEDEVRESKVVIIGTHLKEDEIRDGLHRLLAK